MENCLPFASFNKLSNKEKLLLLDEDGIHLGVDRMKGAHQVALFYMYGFYVEVFFNQESDKIDKAIAFEEYKKLDQYLLSIDLTSIYALL